VDLDGSLFGPVVNNGLPKDSFFLLWESPGHNRSTDETLAETWQHSKGWKRGLVLEGVEHNAFSDLPLVAELIGLQGQVVDVLGTINGTRVLEILPRYLSAFFDLAIRGREAGLLEGPSKEFPEVVFLA
jgi:hypothetical protein